MSTALRIAVADDEPDTRTFLERSIPTLGHAVSSVAADGRQLVEHCTVAPPDVIIADVKMPRMGGLEAIEAVNRHTPVPAIVLTGYTDPPLVARARDLGVTTYLVKPVTEADLGPAIALARRHFEVVQALRREAADLRQALEDRKVIERAKGAVTRRLQVTEADAYLRMRKLASRDNRKIIDLAREILTAEDVFHTLEGAGE